jgi:hypothetical protein
MYTRPGQNMVANIWRYTLTLTWGIGHWSLLSSFRMRFLARHKIIINIFYSLTVFMALPTRTDGPGRS